MVVSVSPISKQQIYKYIWSVPVWFSPIYACYRRVPRKQTYFYSTISLEFEIEKFGRNRRKDLILLTHSLLILALISHHAPTIVKWSIRNQLDFLITIISNQLKLSSNLTNQLKF